MRFGRGDVDFIDKSQTRFFTMWILMNSKKELVVPCPDILSNTNSIEKYALL
jgi:hypothetical protein